MEFNDQLMKDITQALNIKKSQVETVLKLLEEGNTVPFIARYRKEVTGSLDEDQIRAIHKEYEYKENLLKRKEDVIRLIDEKGMLTDELKHEILNAEKLVDVEDIYRPFKEKKKTKATEAIKKGLEPLANFILTFPNENELNEAAKTYINDDVTSVADAIEGAGHIIAEQISDSSDYRKWIRQTTFEQGLITSSKKSKAKDENRTYEIYYDFEEPVRKVKLYRVLALNRGEKEKVLDVKITIDASKITDYLYRQVAKNDVELKPLMMGIIEDAYKRLIMPSIEREIRASLTERAEDNAIHIFSENLRSLLLQPPLKEKVILGVDPAFRTGCKLAVVNQFGTLEEIDVIYPHPKSTNEKVSQDQRNKDGKKVIQLLQKYDIDIIAIGNGTASRETEQFVINVIKAADKFLKKNVLYIIVNEAGASVYSASKLAQSEFPKLQVEERSAVSIARRLQDPLSELVKIDPKAIGVGQYQHDVTQKKLSESLDFVVETVVNQVGVNVNTASAQLLQHIAGLNKTIAENIVTYREKNGEITSRDELRSIPKLGDKTFEQAAGFLRVLNSDHPFDKTGIHPESYELAQTLLDYFGYTYDDIGNPILKLKLRDVDFAEVAKELGAGKETIEDIIDMFAWPLRDPRDDAPGPVLRSDVLKLEDLKVGMELQGTVRNVVDFGVFVDCGVKEDGLVHISQLSNSYVKHPLEVVQVGDIVKIWVKEIDLKRHRLQLTMIRENAFPA
jgi:uncharacterized protein